MPIVLVHNDVVMNPDHQWDDVEGVRYHFPSSYRQLAVPGTQFVYYRGTHREGGRRGPAEYVGCGLVGHVWADTQRPRAWYCAVEDYERFQVPVLAQVDGVNREQPATPNLWRNGVRILSEETYRQIVEEGLGHPAQVAANNAAVAGVVEVNSLLVHRDAAEQNPGRGNNRRRSRRAKAIGDWAERAALQHLQQNLDGCTEYVHRSMIGETPGWDIDFVDDAGALQRVEVKGTLGVAFAGVDLTANEMRAAREHGENYILCLVARCETPLAQIQLIRNPAQRLMAGDWTATPTIFTVRF